MHRLNELRGPFVKGKSFTWFAGIGLHKLALGASLREFRCQPGKLGQHLVNESHLGRKVVLVNVLGEEAANIA